MTTYNRYSGGSHSEDCLRELWLYEVELYKTVLLWSTIIHWLEQCPRKVVEIIIKKKSDKIKIIIPCPRTWLCSFNPVCKQLSPLFLLHEENHQMLINFPPWLTSLEYPYWFRYIIYSCTEPRTYLFLTELPKLSELLQNF